MTDFEKICCFENLYKAHCAARRGKRDTREVIEFELNLSENLTRISQELKAGTYQMSGYYSFYVHDPKERKIHALHYCDRVVQHCLCDEVLGPLLDKKLIYDNAACRLNKGTHFALRRLSSFINNYYRNYGTEGYFLKCDIHKFFDSIDHEVLKSKLCVVITDKDVRQLLFQIIDSFEVTPGKGIPMGNQTSQWFAIYYLDGFDRIIKEQLGIKYYTRYMDDCVLIHRDKNYLKYCKSELENYLENELHLSFNEKTQIFPLKNGVDYLGFHTYLTESGKVIRKLRQQTKKRYKRKLKFMQSAYASDNIELEEIKQVLASFHAHLSFGHSYKLEHNTLSNFVLTKTSGPLKGHEGVYGKCKNSLE